MPIEFVGINDTFGETGDQMYLDAMYGLNENAIMGAVRRALLRRCAQKEGV